ncbi:UNVERIFIED_CONTAM: hypothetical protein RMT77_001242 [Armadillidium vulgare]
MKKDDKYNLKLLKCLQVYCQTVVYNVLKDLYYHHPKSKKGQLNVEDFNVAVRNSRNCKLIKNIVRDFPDKFELNYNDGSDSNEYLDIVICLNFIKLIIYHDPANLTEIIHGEVINLIELRNKLCHKTLKVNDLQKCKQDLLKYMENICNTVGDRYDKKDKYQLLYGDTERLVNKLWDFDENMINKLWDLDEDKFASQCRGNVIKIYSNLYKTGIDKSFSEEVFIEHLEKFAKPLLLDLSKNCSHSYINLKNIFKEKKLAVITGEAGYGKSTICKTLVLSFCHEQKPFSNYDLVLLIDVKNVKEEATLYQYLTKILFKETLIVDDEDLIYFLLRKLRILFIIDDYDEMSKYSKSILDSLFKSFKDKHFLFTTKCYFAKNLLEQLNVHFLVDPLIIKLRGLENMKDLIPFLKSPKSLENKYRLSRDLSENIKVPAISSMLLYVNHHHKCMEKFTTLTMTAMYIQIHKYQKDILLSHIDGINLKEINEFYLKIYKYCFEVCEKDSKTSFIDNDLVGIPYSRIAEQVLKTLFKPSLNLWSIDQNPFGHYEMIHESLCEFLAAYHIFLLITVEKKNLEKIFSSNLLKCKELIFHLVGILHYEEQLYNYLNSIIKILEEVFKDDLNILWNILCQTMMYTNFLPDKKICNVFGTSKLLPSHLKLNDETVESGISLLAFINNYNPGKIEITLQNQQLNKISFDTLKDKGKLRNTKLILRTNYYKSGSYFPTFLNPSFIKLVEFDGAVNENDLRILMQFKTLENLKIKLNLDVLKTLIDEIHGTNWKSLKELHLLFKNPFAEKLDNFGSLNLAETTKLVIEFLEEKDLDLTVSSLKKLKENIIKKKLKGVIIRIDKNLDCEKDLNYVKEHFRDLKDIIEKYLVVKSNVEIHYKQKDYLEEELGCIHFTWGVS